MKIKINDPFGFQKAINFEKLDDPKTLKKLSDIFGIKDPQTTYKKSVNKLKKGLKKWLFQFYFWSVFVSLEYLLI